MSASHPAPLYAVKVRRDYNSWVARESLEDYALRYTPQSFRRWSPWRVAHTALGGAAAFLVLEAVGAAMLTAGGFVNAAWAILAVGLVILLAGLPISVYAARYGVDMDLLTRGAGFGYLGSAVTSLLYAAFTFIFFALEAAIMAYALELGFGLPPAWGYVLCTVAVLPLVAHGVTAISRLQVWTQPLWLGLLLLPYGFVLARQPEALSGFWHYVGAEGGAGGFDLRRFGAAFGIGIALIAQMGEQADYLRFMPPPAAGQRRRWWLACLAGGPGWVLPGMLKMLGGALLAWLVLDHGQAGGPAPDPARLYWFGYARIWGDGRLALAATVLFVLLSQLKINVTNAYAGSLAWSNFFARLTHSHPGRVVWVAFNLLIALLLMELEIFQALAHVLALFANLAIAWMVTVAADLAINKPLGLSPPGIEFRRGYLYDVNPVGLGSLVLASAVSVSAHLGALGEQMQPLAPFLSLLTALLATPALAWLSGGRYYLARQPASPPAPPQRCVLCRRLYEPPDMVSCPAYRGWICSLCCTLDARCDDRCKPKARLDKQWRAWLSRLLPRACRPYLQRGLADYLLLMTPLLAGMGLLMAGLSFWARSRPALEGLAARLPQLGAGLLLGCSVLAWWLVLLRQSRQVARQESKRQTQRLLREIASHRRTDALLQKARRDAEQANQAKSRYVSTLSHELRTPLNSMLGYAQILDGDPEIPPSKRPALAVIRRSGDHLLSVIEGTLDLARIESGRLSLEPRPLDFAALIGQLTAMFQLQARDKGLGFRFLPQGEWPALVRADERRLRQILINLLGNAVKFTTHGEVSLGLRYQGEVACFDIADTGPGIAPEEAERVFEPFERGGGAAGQSGSGLGLTIAGMLTSLMGGELRLDSRPGGGCVFTLRLFLPRLGAAPAAPLSARVGYQGRRRRVLLVDNHEQDREMLASALRPLGFEVEQAAGGQACLDWLEQARTLPDLVCMDLAMPGLDGWETLRRIRRRHGDAPALAVISANAFERGQDNDAGIRAEDFFVKPIRVEQLLDWIGRRLQLEWLSGAEPALRWPPEEALEELRQALQRGYLRGARAALLRLEVGALGADPAYGPFLARARSLLDGCRLDELLRWLPGAPA